MLIKAIIGLGNPGPKFHHHRHNIGFRILDTLAERHHESFTEHGDMEKASITINDNRVLLIKPQTFMNDSGKIIPYLQKQGIKTEEILVVHDELEKPFGKVLLRTGGSARGHNGLKSIIEKIGKEFHRLRVGIGRPEHREDVPNYVLSNFFQTPEEINTVINEAADIIEDTMSKHEDS